ncbi:MAG: hypothetical protein KOO63_15565 [Bacteroidales bacterium]|nr:hypothetical protein [Candidatus Latescibacterota bacterium]
MPITYSFDHDRRLILTKVTGELDLALTEEYFALLQQDDKCPDKAIEIVDFSAVSDFSIHYGEMSRITDIYQGTKSGKDIQATIFNCTSKLSYGIARMLQALHEFANDKHIVIITRSNGELEKCIEDLRSNKAEESDTL